MTAIARRILGFALLLLTLFSGLYQCTNKDTNPQELIEIDAVQSEEIGDFLGIQNNIVTFENSIFNYFDYRPEYYFDIQQFTKGFSEEQINTFRSYFYRTNGLINFGQTRKGIEQIDSLYAHFPQLDSIQPNNRFIHHLKGIAYIRLGEQENCILYHSSNSCIVPILDDGIHRLQSGSRIGIKIYNELLASDESDLQAMWLMNLAYMTLGLYPDSVPNQYLVDLNTLSPNYTYPKFVNKSLDYGINKNGLSGNVITDDFNNDGFDDIIESSGHLRGVTYFQHNGIDGYNDKMIPSGLAAAYPGLNTIQADYDNDGDLDFLILKHSWTGTYGLLSLMKNDGNNYFKESNTQAGLLDSFSTQAAVWIDVDNDGNLDLIVGNEDNSPFTSPFIKIPPKRKSSVFLYKGNGDGTFTAANANSGLQITGYVKGILCNDFNNDGYQDVYVSVLGGENGLFINQGKKSSQLFVNKAEEAGVELPRYSFSVMSFDIDHDGNEDLIVPSFPIMYHSKISHLFAGHLRGDEFNKYPPKVYRNNGDGTFTDQFSLSELGYLYTTIGCNFGDIDNDGFFDFYVGTGAPDYSAIIPNLLFRNSGNFKFDNLTVSTGMGHIQKGHGIAWFDPDRDGDQDIYLVAGGAYKGDAFQNAYFENPGNENNFIILKLESNRANRGAIGAKVRIHTKQSDGKLQVYYHRVGHGSTFGSSTLQIEAGIGKANAVDSIRVNWPDRNTNFSVYTGFSMNKKYLIRQDQAIPIEVDYSPVPFRVLEASERLHCH